MSEQVICQDTGIQTPVVRVILDLSTRQLIFENCHIKRSFTTMRSDQSIVVGLDQVRSVREAMNSLWIRTETGNVRVFDTWTNYGVLRQHLLRLPSRDPWYTSPKLVPVYAVLAVILLVVLLFWFA